MLSNVDHSHIIKNNNNIPIKIKNANIKKIRNILIKKNNIK